MASTAGSIAGFPLFHPSVDLDEAAAILERADLADGLPLVPPTAERVERMLGATPMPHRSRGRMPPLFGELTPDALAYLCVLAGCRPGALPPVLAAAEASLDPDFNLLGVSTTTGSAALALVVHGPQVERLGISAGTNCLGPGTRANACIGRALALVLRNVGGARPGIGDMATLGQPGKYTFCFAAHDSPLASLGPEGAGVDAVTVLAVSGTVEVLPRDGAATPEEILEPVARVMAATAAAADGGRPARARPHVLLLPPELADIIERAGWSRASAQSCLFESVTDSHTSAIAPGPEDMHLVVTGGPGVKMACLPLWAGGTRPITRAVA